jgi:hypothetical protein
MGKADRAVAPLVRIQPWRPPIEQSAYRVWNGIFATGDRRPESGLKTVSPNRDRNSDTTFREKWPQMRPSRLLTWRRGFRKTAWWAHQGSNLGPAD